MPFFGLLHIFTLNMVTTYKLVWKSIINRTFHKDQTKPQKQLKVTPPQTFVLMKMFWRRLEEDFRLRLQKTSLAWRRLQDVLIKRKVFALLISLEKMSWRRLLDVLIKTNIYVLVIRLEDVFKTFSRRLQDVFRTSSRRLAKTSSRSLAKTSSRHLQHVLQRCLQEIFKTYI